MILYGAGRHARVVIDCLLDSDIEVEGIFDDKSDLVSLNGFDVFGEYTPNEYTESEMVITVGDNNIRKKLSNIIKHKFGIAKHPSAIISKYAKIEIGCVILHGSIIQTGTTIGKHSIINTGSSVDHDCRLGDYVHISPRVTLCDGVIVGEGVHIGAGATILPNITIGKWCVIGAGAVITESLPDYSLVVGVPGKVIRNVND